MPYCSNCGATVYDTATRCYRCGSGLGEFGFSDDGTKLPLDWHLRILRLGKAPAVVAIVALALLCITFFFFGGQGGMDRYELNWIIASWRAQSTSQFCLGDLLLAAYPPNLSLNRTVSGGRPPAPAGTAGQLGSLGRIANI